MSQPALTLYSFPLSGNAHRAELALSLMKLPYEVRNIDLRAGEQRSDWFRSLNPAGKVPVLVDGDVVLAESTAILIYLAAKFDDGTWWPTNPLHRAKIQQWLTLTSTELAQGPTAARVITLFRNPADASEAREKAVIFLGFLDQALKGRDWLVGERASLADIALYSYVAHAPEGLVSLAPHANVRAWISRMEALDGFTPMVKTDVSALV